MVRTPSSPSVTTIHVRGMHCGSCEILLEREIGALPGVAKVTVSRRRGTAVVTLDPAHPATEQRIVSVIRRAGYSVESDGSTDPRQGGVKWLEIGASLVIIFAIYKFLTAFNLVSLAPSTTGALSYGGILLIGLVAGMSSCLAVTGGLLLAAAAVYNEVNQSTTPWQRFQPLLQFNLGRLVSYFVLGGVIGWVGQGITLGSRTAGAMNIVIALVMLAIGLSILGILPKGTFGLRLPKSLSHWIAGLAENRHPLAPLLLGALTFFLPCGFTQSLQVVALSSGSFSTGAITMALFALGTLPSLLFISVLSSAASGTASRLFLRFAGTLVTVLAVFNLHAALTLVGVDVGGVLPSTGGTADFVQAADLPPITNGVQEVAMRVRAEGYEPSVIPVRVGVPVRWVIDGTEAYGCNGSIVIPSLGISRTLVSGPNIIEFTPQKTGKLLFSCSMGMYRGAFDVRS